MTQYLKINGEETDLTIPDGFKVVKESEEIRNGEQVTITRYQKDDKIEFNNAHVTTVSDEDGTLLSYNNFAYEDVDGKMPSEKTAIDIAKETFNEINPAYADGLQYMRVDHLTRDFHDDNGNEIEIPILWVKFAHSNGSYNWVSVGPNDTVIEMEIDSRWDYFGGRRATEEWNYDNWVMARLGLGPQLAAPEALA